MMAEKKKDLGENDVSVVDVVGNVAERMYCRSQWVPLSHSATTIPPAVQSIPAERRAWHIAHVHRWLMQHLPYDGGPSGVSGGCATMLLGLLDPKKRRVS
jgi:hypothetical protein